MKPRTGLEPSWLARQFEVCEAGFQRRENELDEAHRVPPPPEGHVLMAIESSVVGVKTRFSIVCDRGEIHFFLSSRSCA